MISMTDLFPGQALQSGEEELLATIFSNPIVRKYLKNLMRECARDLLDVPILEETPESIKSKHLLVSGQLQALSTLLSIKE